MGRRELDRADVNQVFEKFKEGELERIADDDVETRLDLGIAYAEMGLFDDAEGEFALVLKYDPTNARALAETALLHRRRDPDDPNTQGSD